MVETIREWLGLLDAIPLEARVCVLGAVFGIGATHYLKRRILPEHWRTPRIIEGLSILLTTLPVTRFWPHGAEQGAWVGATLGLAVVLAYKPVVRWACRKWPHLEDRLSAVKAVRTKSGEVELRSVEVESSAGEETLWQGSTTEVPEQLKDKPE